MGALGFIPISFAFYAIVQASCLGLYGDKCHSFDSWSGCLPGLCAWHTALPLISGIVVYCVVWAARASNNSILYAPISILRHPALLLVELLGACSLLGINIGSWIPTIAEFTKSEFLDVDLGYPGHWSRRLWLVIFLSFAGWKVTKTIINTYSYFCLTNPYQPAQYPKLQPRDVTVFLTVTGDAGPGNRGLVESIESIILNQPGNLVIATHRRNAGPIRDLLERIDAVRQHTTISVAAFHDVNWRDVLIRLSGGVDTPITAYVDEGVRWPSTFLRSALAPFDQDNVGLVGTVRRGIRNHDTDPSTSFYNYLACINLERQNLEFTSTYNLDGGVALISDSTSLIRTSILHDQQFDRGFRNEYWKPPLFFHQYWFWMRIVLMVQGRANGVGRITTAGDYFKTRYAMKKDWKVVFHNHPDALVHTSLCGQQFKNSLYSSARTIWRSYSTSLFGDLVCWWKYPWTTCASYLDWLSDFPLVVDPLMFFALWKAGYGKCATPLGVVLLIGKIIEPLLHIFHTRNIHDVLYIVPHILFEYVYSIMKLIAFLTVDDVEDSNGSLLQGFLEFVEFFSWRWPRATFANHAGLFSHNRIYRQLQAFWIFAANITRHSAALFLVIFFSTCLVGAVIKALRELFSLSSLYGIADFQYAVAAAIFSALLTVLVRTTAPIIPMRLPRVQYIWTPVLGPIIATLFVGSALLYYFVLEDALGYAVEIISILKSNLAAISHLKPNDDEFRAIKDANLSISIVPIGLSSIILFQFGLLIMSGGLPYLRAGPGSLVIFTIGICLFTATIMGKVLRHIYHPLDYPLWQFIDHLFVHSHPSFLAITLSSSAILLPVSVAVYLLYTLSKRPGIISFAAVGACSIAAASLYYGARIIYRLIPISREQIAPRLQGLLYSVSERVGGDSADEIHQFLADYGYLGLALIVALWLAPKIRLPQLNTDRHLQTVYTAIAVVQNAIGIILFPALVVLCAAAAEVTGAPYVSPLRIGTIAFIAILSKLIYASLFKSSFKLLKARRVRLRGIDERRSIPRRASLPNSPSTPRRLQTQTQTPPTARSDGASSPIEAPLAPRNTVPGRPASYPSPTRPEAQSPKSMSSQGTPTSLSGAMSDPSSPEKASEDARGRFLLNQALVGEEYAREEYENEIGDAAIEGGLGSPPSFSFDANGHMLDETGERVYPDMEAIQSNLQEQYDLLEPYGPPSPMRDAGAGLFARIYRSLFTPPWAQTVSLAEVGDVPPVRRYSQTQRRAFAAEEDIWRGPPPSPHDQGPSFLRRLWRSFFSPPWVRGMPGPVRTEDMQPVRRYSQSPRQQTRVIEEEDEIYEAKEDEEPLGQSPRSRPQAIEEDEIYEVEEDEQPLHRSPRPRTQPVEQWDMFHGRGPHQSPRAYQSPRQEAQSTDQQDRYGTRDAKSRRPVSWSHRSKHGRDEDPDYKPNDESDSTEEFIPIEEIDEDFTPLPLPWASNGRTAKKGGKKTKTNRDPSYRPPRVDEDEDSSQADDADYGFVSRPPPQASNPQSAKKSAKKNRKNRDPGLQNYRPPNIDDNDSSIAEEVVDVEIPVQREPFKMRYPDFADASFDLPGYGPGFGPDIAHTI